MFVKIITIIGAEKQKSCRIQFGPKPIQTPIAGDIKSRQRCSRGTVNLNEDHNGS